MVKKSSLIVRKNSKLHLVSFKRSMITNGGAIEMVVKLKMERWRKSRNLSRALNFGLFGKISKRARSTNKALGNKL